ncbi:MAG TPA: hypothetical protein VF014_11680 [Casimicrobiaceae bacterium]|nr:hypothetical protein [Casimicrobiaceae bacterium]
MPAQPKVSGQHVQSAGTHEHLHEAGAELAERLGWSGEDDWEQSEIRVADARTFLGKCLHEAFEAAAKSLPEPSAEPIMVHLALSSDEDRAAIVSALNAAHTAGVGAPLTSHPIRYADLGGAGLRLQISRAEEAAGKLG